MSVIMFSLYVIRSLSCCCCSVSVSGLSVCFIVLMKSLDYTLINIVYCKKKTPNIKSDP